MIKTFLGNVKIYIPNPTWGNHVALFKNSGLTPTFYQYYDANTKHINFDGFMNDIRNADNGSVFMLHACAHNPTGKFILYNITYIL